MGACGGSKESPPEPNPPAVTPATPVNRLFEKTRSDVQLATERQEFVEQEAIKLSAARNKFYLHNQPARYNGYPGEVPLFFGYYNDTHRDLLVISFPEAFRHNIPEIIKNEIVRHDLNQLDLFLAVQSFDGPCLKTHRWAGEGHNTPSATGDYFSRSILMAVYQPDGPHPETFSNQVLVNNLTPSLVYIHDTPGTPRNFSPDNGYTGLNQDRVNLPEGFSVWSLAIDTQAKRAVVTLHWILNVRIRALNLDLLGDCGVGPANGDRVCGTLQQLIHRLDQRPLVANPGVQPGGFQGSPLLQKLKDLIQY